MIRDAFGYLRDVSGYLKMTLNERVRHLPGLGVDYTRSEFDHAAQRAVEKLHPRRMKLEVTETISETPSTVTLWLRRLDGRLPPFRAGQYVNLFVTIEGVRTSRPFSISSPPGLDRMDLTIKKMSGGFVSPFLTSEVAVGDVLESSGPAGGFYYEPLIDGRDLVFLAGGSGITPFMSIIRERAESDVGTKVHLLYGSRATDDVIFGEELRQLAETHDWLTVDEVISEPSEGFEGLSGVLDAELIRTQVEDLEGKTFYVCGPGAMYDLCAAALEELGVSKHHIRRELYGPPTDVTGAPDWPEEVNADDVFEVGVEGRGSLRARATEPLLNSLEREGFVVPVLCRAGECSSCRIRLLSGEVFMPREVGLRSADRVGGYIHSCMAYPLSDLEIRL